MVGRKLREDGVMIDDGSLDFELDSWKPNQHKKQLIRL